MPCLRRLVVTELASILELDKNRFLNILPTFKIETFKAHIHDFLNPPSSVPRRFHTVIMQRVCMVYRLFRARTHASSALSPTECSY